MKHVYGPHAPPNNESLSRAGQIQSSTVHCTVEVFYAENKVIDPTIKKEPPEIVMVLRDTPKYSLPVYSEGWNREGSLCCSCRGAAAAMAMDLSNSDEFAVGCSLAIKTTLGDEFEAQIITFDKPSNILVLQEGSKSGTRRNVRLLKANYIKDFTLLGQGEDPLDVKKCYLDLNSLQAREESAIRQAEVEAERIGVGVTSEAQNIFDALSKTLPVRWDKTVIVVMNEVRVSSPYLPECVIGGIPAANERVKKVLEFERKRLQARGPA